MDNSSDCIHVMSIKAINDKYRLVSLDNDFYFKIAGYELNKLKLKEDDIVTSDVYNSIYIEYGLKRCRFKAIDILSRTDKTEVQLRQKLNECYFCEKVVDEIISELKVHRYIDDMRYAINYINYKSSSKSRYQIINELRLRGVDSDIISKAVEDEYNRDNEIDIIKKYIRKYSSYDNVIDKDKLVKIYSGLARKGISYNSVKAVISEYYTVE